MFCFTYQTSEQNVNIFTNYTEQQMESTTIYADYPAGQPAIVYKFDYPVSPVMFHLGLDESAMVYHPTIWFSHDDGTNWHKLGGVARGTAAWWTYSLSPPSNQIVTSVKLPTHHTHAKAWAFTRPTDQFSSDYGDRVFRYRGSRYSGAMFAHPHDWYMARDVVARMRHQYDPELPTAEDCGYSCLSFRKFGHHGTDMISCIAGGSDYRYYGFRNRLTDKWSLEEQTHHCRGTVESRFGNSTVPAQNSTAMMWDQRVAQRGCAISEVHQMRQTLTQWQPNNSPTPSDTRYYYWGFRTNKAKTCHVVPVAGRPRTVGNPLGVIPDAVWINGQTIVGSASNLWTLGECRMMTHPDRPGFIFTDGNEIYEEGVDDMPFEIFPDRIEFVEDFWMEDDEWLYGQPSIVFLMQDDEFKCGTYTGTGSSLDITTNLGYQGPVIVRSAETAFGSPAEYLMYPINAGENEFDGRLFEDQYSTNSDLLTNNWNGFRIASSSIQNRVGETYLWWAWSNEFYGLKPLTPERTFEF